MERHHLDGETISKMAAKTGVVLDVVRLSAPESPKVLMDLQQYSSPKGKSRGCQVGRLAHSHFCFGVPDVWGAYRELSAQGVNLFPSR